MQRFQPVSLPRSRPLPRVTGRDDQHSDKEDEDREHEQGEDVVQHSSLHALPVSGADGIRSGLGSALGKRTRRPVNRLSPAMDEWRPRKREVVQKEIEMENVELAVAHNYETRRSQAAILKQVEKIERVEKLQPMKESSGESEFEPVTKRVGGRNLNALKVINDDIETENPDVQVVEPELQIDIDHVVSEDDFEEKVDDSIESSPVVSRRFLRGRKAHHTTSEDEVDEILPVKRSKRILRSHAHVSEEDAEVAMRLRQSTRATRTKLKSPRKRKSSRPVSEYSSHFYDETENHDFGNDSKPVAYNNSDSSEEKLKPSNKRSDGAINDLGFNLNDLGLFGAYNAKSKKSGEKADADPIDIDPSVDWTKVGGLDSHVNSLKEMVILPMLYPDLFTKFAINPPSGVLFHGPPGTGKTLVARALANTCSSHGQKVSFFMRKGADCLSKWVGEAERQLRLLFEQAKENQPSIIFFDEIDGLAPVRSSRQDQIHSSIVSTLLALMDGINSRGQVIIIGATNRPDAIDPALRRPGRFDRELYFPLPSKHARRSILTIHTQKWLPSLSDEILEWLSNSTAGFCGADIRALCAEASLKAVRRTFPQIYQTTHKLIVDLNAIIVSKADFEASLQSVTPASQRSAASLASALPAHLVPLLSDSLKKVVSFQETLFPLAAKTKSSELSGSMPNYAIPQLGSSGFVSLSNFSLLPIRPRMLIHGDRGLGQAYLASALLQSLEEYPVYSIDLPILLGDGGSKNAEEVLLRQVTEAKRNAPSILFWPHADMWWDNAPESLRCCVELLLADIPSEVPLFILATADCRFVVVPDLDYPLYRIFSKQQSVDISLEYPNQSARKLFFSCLLRDILIAPVAPLNRIPASSLMKLNVLTVDTAYDQMIQQRKVDEDAELEREVMRKLRLFLRSVVLRIMKIYKEFIDPVTDETYLQIIVQPICLMDIENRINNNTYLTIKDFLRDIDLLVSNCKEYCEAVGTNSRLISKVHQLQDTVLSMVAQIDRLFIKKCESISEKKRTLLAKSVHQENQASLDESQSIQVAQFSANISMAAESEADVVSITSGPVTHTEVLNDSEIKSEEICDIPEITAMSEEAAAQEALFSCVVNQPRLESLVDELVSRTENQTIDFLESILFQLYRLLHAHFDRPNKYDLLNEMEQKIKSY